MFRAADQYLSLPLLLILTVFCLPTKAELNPLEEFEADYKVFRKGDDIGYAKRSLKQLEDGSFELYSRTYAEMFIFEDDREETSTFFINNGNVAPSKYFFAHSGVASEKDNLLIFDYDKQKVLQSDNRAVKIPWATRHDQLSYQQQIKMDIAGGNQQMKYLILDRKAKAKEYEFEVLAEEQLTLPVGKVNTVKLKRIRENNKRETYLWLSLDHNLALARLQQFRKGNEQADIQLANYKPKTFVHK